MLGSVAPGGTEIRRFVNRWSRSSKEYVISFTPSTTAQPDLDQPVPW